MSWDRDLYIDTVPQRRSKFEAEGLPVETRWNTALPVDLGRLVAGPAGQGLRPQRQVLPARPRRGEEAARGRRLSQRLRDYLRTTYRDPSSDPPKQAARSSTASSAEIGIKSKINQRRLPEGVHPELPRRPGPVRGLVATCRPPVRRHRRPADRPARRPVTGRRAAMRFRGLQHSGRNDQSGDPQVDAMIEKARIERDTEKATSARLRRFSATSPRRCTRSTRPAAPRLPAGLACPRQLPRLARRAHSLPLLDRRHEAALQERLARPSAQLRRTSFDSRGWLNDRPAAALHRVTRSLLRNQTRTTSRMLLLAVAPSTR